MFILFLILILTLVEADPIRCDQLYFKEWCSDAPHCQWLDMKVCKKRGKRCTNLEYGCVSRTFCEVGGSQSVKKKQCQRLKNCSWNGKRCQLRDTIEKIKEANIYLKNNLCWSAVNNGQCDDCYFSERGQRECWCWPRSDYTDCYTLFGEKYINLTKQHVWRYR